MSINNALYYNGVWLDIVKLMEHSQEPQYNGQNYVHTKHRVTVRAVVSNDSQRKYVRNRTTSFGDGLYPKTGLNNASTIPTKFELNDPRILEAAPKGDFVRTYNQAGEIFDANGVDLHTPMWDVQAVRHHLLQPRGVLVYYLNDNLVLACPQYPFAQMGTDQINAFRSMDAKNGPMPRMAKVHSLADRVLTVDFTIECYINESMALQQLNKTLYVSAHSYFVDIDVDTYGMETRSVSGVVNFRADLLKQDNLVPDDFREFFAPPIPFGFKREVFSVKVDPDNCKIQYKLVDREVHYTINRFVGKNDAWIGDSTRVGKGVIDRSKIMRMQVLQTKSRTICGLHEGVAGAFNIPDSVEHLTVRIFGNNFASRYELERVAFYIMVMRLPYTIDCSKFSHEVRHDLVGQYVELYVTRVSKGGFEMFRNFRQEWNIVSNVHTADDKAVKNGGILNLLPGAGVVYYPAATVSQIGGGEDIENVTYSAANPTEYDSKNQPGTWVFDPANFDDSRNMITENAIGTNANNKVRFVNEFNQDYAGSYAVPMPGFTRARGSAGTVAVVHTSALLDPADPINQPNASSDMAHIKRINTDYRYRDLSLASSTVLAINAQNELRPFLDQYGNSQQYLNNPTTVQGFYALPMAPESYYYQVDA